MAVKLVMTITELIKEGYPESIIRQIARSSQFEKVGFATGQKRKTYYFHTDKLNELLKKGESYWS